MIALTHMRIPNDLNLANEVDEIDLILGGHDHHKFNQMVFQLVSSMNRVLKVCFNKIFELINR